MAAGRAANDLDVPTLHSEPLGDRLDDCLVRAPVFRWSGDVHFQRPIRLRLHLVLFGARGNANRKGNGFIHDIDGSFQPE